jgi:uncharacterized membrane protein YedE/YeeE
MKNKIYDVILFVGGAFIFTISLTGGYSGGAILRGGISRSTGFVFWSIIGMAIGVSMIVFGFLRRSWNKKDE